jgi:hypothetical protein
VTKPREKTFLNCKTLIPRFESGRRLQCKLLFSRRLADSPPDCSCVRDRRRKHLGSRRERVSAGSPHVAHDPVPAALCRSRSGTTTSRGPRARSSGRCAPRSRPGGPAWCSGHAALPARTAGPAIRRELRMQRTDAACRSRRRPGGRAAPTYLPSFTGRDGVRFIDGGVWANCPVTVGILEAIAVLGRRPQEIDVLSIGTTQEPFDVSRRRTDGGIASWNRHLVELLMQGQVKGALAQARLLTDHVRLLRVDETVRRGRFALDAATPAKIEELKALGVQRARHDGPDIEERFFQTPVDPFEPIHKLQEY